MTADIYEIFLLVILLFCGIYACLSRNLLVTLIVYMAFSVVISIIWALLKAPDLAITEAAVGAGVSGILLFMALKKIYDIRKAAEDEKREKED